jgi:hypothetical protein
VKFLKRYGVVIVAACLVAVVSYGGSIKVWVAEALRYVDLNANFAHIHNTMVGGHGARLVDADVSASAAIAHSKLATPALVPKAWVQVASCASNPCTIVVSSRVTSVNRTGAGVYNVDLSYTPPNTAFSVQITPQDATAARHCVLSDTSASSTDSVEFNCFDAAGAAADSGFGVWVMDNDN